jgi:hypothetical protein
LISKVGFLLCISPFVGALELTVDLYTNIEYTNNVSLVSTKAEDDITQILGLNVLVKENRKRFNADASFNLEEEHYYNDTFSNQTSFTSGFGILNFDIVEDFLNWRTSFTRTETLENSAESDTPDNREQRNVFRTGPAMTYRASRKGEVGVSANYTLVENSGSDATDTKRIDSKVNYDYQFNSVTSLSLNGQYDEMLDGDEDDELASANINVGVVRQLTHGIFKFNYGRTQIKSDGSDAIVGNFFDLSLSRQQLLWHDWLVQYKEDISDTSIGFEYDEEGFDNGLDIDESANESAASDEAVTGLDVIRNKRVDISASRILGVFQYSVTGFWGLVDYETLKDDEQSKGGGVSLTQNVTRGLSLGASYAYSLNDFIEQPEIGKDKTNTYRINSRYQLSKNFNLSMHLQYEMRANSRNQAREYEEFATSISLSWQLL